MKSLAYSLLAMVLLCIFSCQKEVSFEQGEPSAGSLKDDVSGDCLPQEVNGTFKAGAALGDTNYIELEVNVTRTGTYTITTYTVNGYSFKAGGIFTSAGPNTVLLKGTGTPLDEGVNDY